MKQIIYIIMLFVFTAVRAQNSAFTVVSTKIIQKSSYSNLFTSFSQSASTGVYTNLASNNAVLIAPEGISDFRTITINAATAAVVKSSINVEPMSGVAMASNTVKFFSFYQVPLNASGQATTAQARVSFRILYELKNTSASAADLFYGLNNNIAYMFSGVAAQRYYLISLYQSNASGSLGSTIYTTGQLTASNFARPRGTAYSNVPANETRYILLDIWAYAGSDPGGGLGIFKVDASHGISVAFDDTAILSTDNLGNNPGLDVNAKMKFKLHNFYANDPTGPTMGSTGAKAYNFLSWDAANSAAYAISENIGLLNSVEGITVTMDGFELFDFEGFGTYGTERDRRVYINGTANIYQNGVLKLRLIDCRMGLNVSYPVPFGIDAPVVGGGSGKVDTVNSDAAWINEFNTNATNRVSFVYNSFSTVINNPWYDATISLAPTDYVENIIGWAVPSGGGIFDYLSQYYTSLNFTSAAQAEKGFYIQAGAGNAMVRMIASNPGGALPVGIDAISPDRYWQLGTTLSSFSVDVSFDLTGVNGINNMSDIRILHRADSNSVWTVLDQATYSINGNVITVAGITSFSDFGIGASGGGSPLPVELTSFSAKNIEEGVLLNWSTATEVNNYGFEIQRQDSKAENFSSIDFVAGNGNSNSQKLYSFKDANPPSGKTQYRLKQIDTDGAFEYSDIVNVEISAPDKFSLSQNYPNPFNPTTTIKYKVGQSGEVNLSLYNMLGQKVMEVVNETKQPGKYQITINTSKLSSGIYLYKLSTQEGSLVKKLTMLK